MTLFSRCVKLVSGMSDRREDGTPVWQVSPSEEMVQHAGGMWGDPVAPSHVRMPDSAPEWSPHRSEPTVGLVHDAASGRWVAPEPTADEIGARIYDR